jgi:hypothetical protein
MRFRPRSVLLSILMPAASIAFAGTVEVSFVQPATYTDAGNTQWDEAANLKALAAHLQGLGQRLLPANQTLRVEVLDVDLAGSVRPAARGATQLRVVRGGADYPRIHLQYTLQADGAAPRSGKEWLTDLNYSRGVARRGESEPLYHEKHMLDEWFKARFADGRAGGG